MAEKKTGDADTDVAEELKRLLEKGEEEGEEEGAEEGEAAPPPQKKLFIIIAGALLLLAAGIGGYFFFSGGIEGPQGTQAEDAKVKPLEPVEGPVEKVHIFKMQPFFLPILENGKETGRFLTVTPNLNLSNGELEKEIIKVLPGLRKNIFLILKRKKSADLIKRKLATEERIKKEILTASNALLLGGTGAIQDVFFSQFIIK